MSLESIVEHILTTAKAEAEQILQGAKQEAAQIIQQSHQEAEALYELLLNKEKALYESQKQRVLVNARLEGRKNLLFARQELIDIVFERVRVELGKNKLKRQQVKYDKIEEVSEDPAFYFKQLKSDYESEIAKIIFT